MIPTFTVCLPLLLSFPAHNFLVCSCGRFFSTFSHREVSVFAFNKSKKNTKVLVAQLGLLFVTPWTGAWNSPSKNTGVGSHSLLQGIFPTQGLNPGALHCRQILYSLSHQGSLVRKNHERKKNLL